MAVSISAMFKLVDQMSDRMEKIGGSGDKAMAKIEKSAAKADQAFTKSQSSVNKLSAVYKNFEGNAEQLANAVQRGEKVLSSMEKTEGETAASTFEYTTKLQAATEAQKNLEQAMQTANTAAKNYENVVNDNAATAEELAAAEENLDNATRDLFAAFDKGAEAALDLEEASDKAADKVKGFGEESEEAAKKGQEFGDKTSDAIKSVESLLVTVGITKLLSEITGALLDCAAAAETVETSGAKLETLAGSQYMGMLSDQIYTISAATGEAQEGLYEVAYNAISAGTDVEKAAEITEAATKLATAGFTSSSSALSVLTTATNSYGKAAGSATDITDGLITVQNLGVTTVGELANSMGKSISTAAAYNVSLGNLESAYISVTKAGINTQEGTTYINAMINELGKSSSEVAKILTEETGKSFGELMTSGYSLADVLEIIYNRAGKNSEAMMNLWGSQTAAVASAAIVNQGLDTFNSNLDTLKNSAGATAKAYSIMADTTEYAHNKMNNSANNLKIAVGDQLNPILNGLYDNVSKTMDSASAFVKENPWVVKAVVALTVSLAAFVTTVTLAKVAVAAFTAVMNTNPIFLAVSAIAALTAGFIALGASIEAANEQERRETLTVTSQKQKDEIEELRAEYEKFKGTSEETSEEASKLRYQIDELSESFEENSRTIGELEDSILENRESISEHIQDYQDTMDGINDQRDSVFGLIQKLEDLVVANDGTAASEGRIKGVIEELNELLPGLGLNFENVTSNVEGYVDIMKKAANIKFGEDKKSAQLESYNQLKIDEKTAQKNYADAIKEYAANQQALASAVGVEPNKYEIWDSLAYVEDLPDDFLADDYDPEKDNNSDSMGLNRAVYARDSLKSVQEQIKAIEDEWAAEAEAAEYAFNHPEDAAEAASNTLDTYKEQIEELCTAYSEAYDAALDSFNGQFGLFDEVITRSEEGAETLTAFEQSTVESAQKALDSQLEYWTTYNENISQLKDLSASDLGLTQTQYDSFMSYVQDGSEEAAGLAASMVSNIKSGNTDAVENLAQTFAAVQEQQETAADQVADWQTDFYDKLDDIQSKMEDTIDGMELDEEAKTAAKNTIENYANELRSGMGLAVSAASDVKSAVEAALSFTSFFDGGSLFSKLFNGGYAEGTDFATRGVHLVGENGPELVVFNGGEQVIPSDDTEDILSRSNGNLNVPESLLSMPTTTYSDSEGPRESKKTIEININGQGAIKVDGSMSREEVVDIMVENARPIMMSILQDEMTEEGEGSYDY